MERLRIMNLRRPRSVASLSAAERLQASAAGPYFDARAYPVEARFRRGRGSFDAVELWDVVGEDGSLVCDLWCVGRGRTAILFKPGTAEVVGATDGETVRVPDPSLALGIADAWRELADDYPEAHLNHCDLEGEAA
ncbi:MAG: hypothetical protein AAGH15_21050 [Myxococcota bacterium]